MIITVDGPAGAGKGTVSRLLAKTCHFTYIDAGLVFRACVYTLRLMSIDNLEKILTMIQNGEIEYCYDDTEVEIRINGKKCPAETLYSASIAESTSILAADAKSNFILCEAVRVLAQKHTDFICDGRNTGSTIFTEADYKFFITASADTRARRRYLQLLQNGHDAQFEDVLSDVIARDQRDSNRMFAPLKVPDGAVVIYNEGDNPSFCISKMMEIIKF